MPEKSTSKGYHLVTIAKRIANVIRGRGYKTVNAVAQVDYYKPINPKAQTKGHQKPVRHPRRKARLLLAKYGIEDIITKDDVDRMFWEMAIRHKSMTKSVINAIHITIDDNNLMNYFNRKLEHYNEFIETKASCYEYKNTEEELKTENIKLKQAIVREVKEKNNMKQKLEQEEGMGRRFAKKFINQLKAPNSKFHQIYDFTKEEDIREFLLWFQLLKRQVGKRTIKGIIKNSLTEGRTPELFMRLVENHNSQFLPDSEEKEYINEDTDI